MTDCLAPLCDQHLYRMHRSMTIPQTFQGCMGDQLCQRRYHPLIGYYGGLSSASAPEIYCATHFHSALYVCAYDAKRDARKYACPERGCEHVAEWVGTGNRFVDHPA